MCVCACVCVCVFSRYPSCVPGRVSRVDSLGVIAFAIDLTDDIAEVILRTWVL